MMTMLVDQSVSFITPAFLAGADQNRPEVRAPSIRGELRWWFRVLGADAAEERAVFGGVGDSAIASALVVRVSEVEPVTGPVLHIPPMSDFGYLYYFAKASGNRDGIHRTEANHYFAPGTSFRLQILTRYPVAPASAPRLALACEAFVRLGALGLRATRGCGAMSGAGDLPDRQSVAEWVAALTPNVVCRLARDETFTDWKACQEALGGWLRHFRKDVVRLSGKEESALGFSLGKKRASSALRLRPVRVAEGFLSLLVYSDAACQQPSLMTAFQAATQPLVAAFATHPPTQDSRPVTQSA